MTAKQEADRAAASLMLAGYVRGLIAAYDVPRHHHEELRKLIDDVSRSYGTMPALEAAE